MNTINIKFKIKGDEPSEVRFGGENNTRGAMTDMQVCVEVVRGSSRTAGMEWIEVDVREADGFAYRSRTTLNDGVANTNFGATSGSNTAKVKARLAEFKEAFELSIGSSLSTIH